MYHIIYLSSATKLFEYNQLFELLDQSRINNQKLNITGALFYDDGSFLQVIEGEKEYVIKLFEKIEKDSRHTRVTLLFSEEIEKRNFENWSMAFTNLKEEMENMPEGFSDILTKPYSKIKLDSFPIQVRAFLEVFYSGKHFSY